MRSKPTFGAADHAAAVAALEWLSSRALANGSAIDLGLAARGRALLSDDADAEEHYEEALAQLGSSGARVAPRAGPAALRGVAPPPEAAPRRPCSTRSRARDVRIDRRQRVRGPDEGRAPRLGRDGAQTGRRNSPATSLRRKSRSLDSRPVAPPIPRSRSSCSSARAPSTTTCARSTESSRSSRVASSPERVSPTA